jgi:hypothetical protein
MMMIMILMRRRRRRRRRRCGRSQKRRIRRSLIMADTLCFGLLQLEWRDQILLTLKRMP